MILTIHQSSLTWHRILTQLLHRARQHHHCKKQYKRLSHLFLLPIDIHEKCYGNFFCPEDQKPSRNDSLEHEEVDLCIKTDYQGYVYWGEYSLCFAGVLHQEECFRLILSRGANPDLQVILKRFSISHENRNGKNLAIIKWQQFFIFEVGKHFNFKLKLNVLKFWHLLT